MKHVYVHVNCYLDIGGLYLSITSTDLDIMCNDLYGIGLDIRY